jgi:hypothetical protein
MNDHQLADRVHETVQLARLDLDRALAGNVVPAPAVGRYGWRRRGRILI